jgi:hypothetical protein
LNLPPDATRARLEASRSELLDLGLRNPLLNYRPPRARGVVVVDELPEQVFCRLVTEAKKLSFLPALEEAGEGLLDQPPDSAATTPAGKALPRHADTRLQTGLAGNQLQAALLATHQAARAFIEERGANVLFMAFGMLEWFEPGNLKEPRRAPLVLVPVSIARASAQARFQVEFSGEELGENLSLAARLLGDYGLTLPPLPAAEDLDIKAYFAQVATAVSEQPSWKIDREAVCLGFFAFGKFLMYRDLDPAVWPTDASPDAHPIIRSLLHTGFNEAAAAIGDDAYLDLRLAPGDPPTVVDADSTQILAIAGARNGRNLVIQGPPGTGKSQTITNMIADALGQGRTVLFVAEKLAALEVVKRRLDAVGLGDACLELHCHKAGKKGVLAELRRTLELGRPRMSPEVEEDKLMYAEARERLNTTCSAINEPVGKTGVSPFQALGALAWDDRLGARADLAQEVEGLGQWTASESKRRFALVERLQAVVGQMGPLASHPYRGAALRTWGPSVAARVRDALKRARAATVALGTVTAELAPHITGVAIPSNAVEAGRLFASLKRLSDPPPLPGLTMDAPEWLQRHEDLQRLTAAGARLTELRRGLDAVVTPEAWEEHLLDVRLQIAARGQSWFRFFNADYRRAMATLTRLCREKPPTSLAGRLALLDALTEAARHRALIRDLQGLGETAFWPHWRALDSDWVSFERATAWLHQLNIDLAAGRLVPELPAAFVAHPNGVPLPAGLENAQIALSEHAAAWTALRAVIEHAEELEALSFAAQLGLLGPWEHDAETLSELVSYNQLAAQLKDEGLAPVLALANSTAPTVELTRALKRAWHEAILERALGERAALAQFSGAAQDIDVARFRELDVAIASYNRASLALRHHDGLPTLRAAGGGASELAVLQRELEKKTRWLPLRQLLIRAGNAVQHIKPVFMMSPLSIATLLAPDGPRFDLVIFDEASQVKPVDALGAIARGRQLVVVGDKLQMPPTDFFDAQLSDDGANAAESFTRDFESVLGLMEAQGAPQHMLRWHYRSRHESLIAVSNQAFYDGKLVVFPSPDAGRAQAGLHLHYLDNAIYDRGGSRTNAHEAAAVASAVMVHARVHADLSLGVAAFSVAQMQAILQAVEKARREDPSCEDFFGAHGNEPFFVKNLETVQGDERDVMMLSTAYGKDAAGKLALNFGPLNMQGGERRLNVLITRARLRCEVYTSLRSDDLPLTADMPLGVKALRDFLAYAATGSLPPGAAPPLAPAVGMEAALAAEIEAMGFGVDRRVGALSCYIDLAVRDPDRPERYLLAVSCDGDSYAGARAARDRDRLRTQVLEGLGWRVHRVWSLDWHNRPTAERRRLLEAIHSARKESANSDAQAPVTQPSASGAPAFDLDRAEPAPRQGPTKLAAYQMAILEIKLPEGGLAAIATNLLAQWVAEVVEIEGPVTTGEVIKRIAQGAGVKRPAGKALLSLERAVDHAVKSGLVVQRYDFLWSVSMDVAPVRDRSAIPSAQRKLELIAPEERARAVEKAVSDGFGLAAEAVAPAAAKLLGYSRPNDDVLVGLQEAVQLAVATGRLAQRGDQLYVVD